MSNRTNSIFLGLAILFVSFTCQAVDLRAQSAVPTPTLDADLLPTFKKLLTTENLNCSSLCWWGLQPDKSTLTDIIGLLSSTGFDRGRNYRMDSSAPENPASLETYINQGEPFALSFDPNRNNIYSFRVMFNMEDNILRSINTQFISPNKWLKPELERIALPSLLGYLSTDGELFFATESIQQFSELGILVVDKSLGMIATYTISVNDFIKPDIAICVGGDNTDEIDLSFSPPTNDYFLEQVKTIENGTFDTVESLWGVKTEEFIQQVKSDPFGCFNPPDYTPTPGAS